MSNISGPINGGSAGSSVGTSASVTALVSAQLAPYITSASASTMISTRLLPYATSASLLTALGPYLTSSSAVTLVANFITSASASTMVASQLSPYLTSSSASTTYVQGPGSSTDNTLPRFDGTTGKLIQASGIVVDDTTNAFYTYKAKINVQATTAYTLLATDTGKIIELNSGSAIALTLPNTLGVGFCCRITQTGAGQITVSAQTGATLHNRQAFTQTAGQWAELDLYVTTNASVSTAVYIMGGDGA